MTSHIMREIKFRGKRADNGEWVYGDLIIDNAENYFIHRREEKRQEASMVYPDTVGQFTGLLDKNGKEIYEGDVLSVLYNISLDRENVCVVYGGSSELTPGFYFSDDGTNDICHTWNVRDFINDGEIIGNIHDTEQTI